MAKVFHKVVVGATTPASPFDGEIWTDTTDVPLPKVYDLGTTAWVPLGVFSADGDPVNGVKATLGNYGGATADGEMTYTAVAYGATGNSITIEYVNNWVSGAALPLAITVTGTDIVVQLATDGSGVATTTGTLMETAINAHAAASLLVLAAHEGTGAGLCAVTAHTHLATGVTCTVGAIPSFKMKSDGSLLYVKTGAQVWKKITLATL